MLKDLVVDKVLKVLKDHKVLRVQRDHKGLKDLLEHHRKETQVLKDLVVRKGLKDL